jgi:hypothetical protein
MPIIDTLVRVWLIGLDMTIRRPPRRALRLTFQESAEATADCATASAIATEVFDDAVDHDYREFAKLGDALRAVQRQLGRAALVRNGQMLSVDDMDERTRRGAEILSEMTAGACSVEGILKLVTLCDYDHLRTRQLTRRPRRAA